MKLKNILITGCNGQLGNKMREFGETSSNNYFYTDVKELDITDLSAIKEFVKANNINIIVNCAAYTNVDKAEGDKDFAELLNAKAVKNLAIAAKESDVTLIHISTDYVFSGNHQTIPFTEEVETNPLGVYGLTKLHGEEAIKNIGCKYLIFRTAWLYSEYGNNFVKTMLKLTVEKPKLKVVFDQVGTPTYAGDLASVIFNVIENDNYQNNNGIYHFSNEGVCSWFDFTKEIARIAGNDKCDIQPCHSDEFPSKVIRPSFSVLDKSKLKMTFDITVPYWTESLELCILNLKNKI